MPKNFILTIEGADGTGKTSIVEKLSQTIEEYGFNNLDLFVTKAPYYDGVFYSELTGMAPSVWYSPRRLAMMWALNHHAHNDRIRQFLDSAKSNALVIADRGVMSSLVYNATGDVTVDEVHSFHQGLRTPDLTVLLQSPTPLLYERIHGRGAPNSEYEADLAQVATNYERIYIYYSLLNIPVIQVDASGTLDQTFQGVLNAIDRIAPRWVRKPLGL